MRILLSNDDGIRAPGLEALVAAFAEDEVWVVAPDREQSATSHSISLHRPLRVIEVGPRRFAVDGTPTDAVYMGLNLILKGRPPDVVISGVNHGPNLGTDVLYSGTVAGDGGGAPRPPRHRRLAGRAAPARVRARGDLRGRAGPPRPARSSAVAGAPQRERAGRPVKGYRFVRLGRRTYGNEVVENPIRAAARTTGSAVRAG